MALVSFCGRDDMAQHAARPIWTGGQGIGDSVGERAGRIQRGRSGQTATIKDPITVHYLLCTVYSTTISFISAQLRPVAYSTFNCAGVGAFGGVDPPKRKKPRRPITAACGSAQGT